MLPYQITNIEGKQYKSDHKEFSHPTGPIDEQVSTKENLPDTPPRLGSYPSISTQSCRWL